MPAKIQTRLQPISKSEAIEQGLDYWFDPDSAFHAIEFFENWLRHSKGKFAGQPFTLLDWQKAMVAELFGWLRVSDNLRRFRVAYVSTAKKQGKSTLLAGIGLYLLVMDGENGAEVYGAAADREQASVIYREMASMVRASPLLSQQLEVIDSRRTIAFRKEASFYRVLSADAFRAEGLNIHALLFDELGCAPRANARGVQSRKNCTHKKTENFGTHSATVAQPESSHCSARSPRRATTEKESAMSSTSMRRLSRRTGSTTPPSSPAFTRWRRGRTGRTPTCGLRPTLRGA